MDHKRLELDWIYELVLELGDDASWLGFEGRQLSPPSAGASGSLYTSTFLINKSSVFNLVQSSGDNRLG